MLKVGNHHPRYPLSDQVPLGMFLYAKLVMENLLNQTSLNNLNDELKPETFPIDWRAA